MSVQFYRDLLVWQKAMDLCVDIHAAALDFPKQAGNSIHFSYEMVALSPRTCIEMGIELSDEDKRKPYVEVSGRKGLGVKADDLIDKLCTLMACGP